MGRADAYLDRGLTDAALAAFGLALEENPDVTQAHLGMGHIYRGRGQYPMAERAYQRAVDTDPNNFDAHYYLALMKQLMGNVREAIAVYLQALAIRPDDFQANRDLAAAYLQTGRPGQALPYAKKATEMGDSAEAWSNLAAAHSLMGQYDEAVQAYRQALEEMDPGAASEPVLLGLADANIKLNRHERAINVLEQLTARSPSSTAYERTGFALFKLGRYDEALGKFRQALSLDPSDTSALNGVGVALMTQYIQGGRNDARLRDQAIDAWRRSVQIRPDQPRIVDLLARYQRL
jgi:tetratricopeptide (TPR) repeat protein